LIAGSVVKTNCLVSIRPYAYELFYMQGSESRKCELPNPCWWNSGVATLGLGSDMTRALHSLKQQPIGAAEA